MALRIPNSHLGRAARLAAGAFLASALLLAAAPADAHRHVRHFAHAAHSRHVVRAAAPSSPTFSAYVVDANSGRALYAADPDGLRHPASITKVMTLYLLFEKLDRGAMTLQSRIPISQHAAAQEPSKLGLDPGETISVEDAIKAVVTRSANDIAVAIAEAVGGDEDTFADMMTRKARALGMSRTTYRNASGLPNDEQITTARDLAVLARSLEDRFPRYFRYFSTESFEYAGETIGNHNHLLGRVDGVDGIKTGYTRASGFNLLTSVHRDGRSLIAVVMGGRSAAARDRVMENLIEDHIAQGSTVRTATRVADASADDQPDPSPPPQARNRPAVVAASVPTRLPTARPAPGADSEGDYSDDDDQPTLRVAAVQTPVKGQPTPVPPRPIAEPPVAAERVADAAPAGKPVTPAALGWKKGADAAPRPAQTTVAARSAGDGADSDTPSAGKGWKIQIGATDDAAKATALLIKARSRDRGQLAAAKPVTLKVRKGDGAYYRAQFAGLDSVSAEQACRSLKRDGFSCFATRD
ncbi:D-alanyl-D-alanine carboxypeptidase [Roseiarcus fermentans]|uniref:D-alanyl-D-alanine carboxypeptidase n=1 Tax=Roseiarcus fermentans TaxID=1473586 RepID=A0A366FRF3_9HYPH|nr:serine hydrolase [Roseiarcus fermentans]RBP16736.1 D-alanyl-D-alanine carboxypeptidase [Roseiarcus fermentans]